MSSPIGSVVPGAEDPRVDSANGNEEGGLKPSFAYNDLREWIAQAEKLGEIRIVSGASWEEEIGMAAEVVLHSDTAPCVIFDNVRGCPKGFRVLTNFFGGKRKNMTLGFPPGLNRLELSRAFLETYLKAIRPALLQGKGGRHASASDRVFISQRAAPLSKNALGELVEKYARIAGVNKHVTCHIWRHSCATHLVKNKANLRHVQELLGHRDLSTTERYLHLTIADLKEAHRKCHPREKQADHL